MDEPFGAVDPITRQRLQDELLSIQRELRKTIVCVTHDIDEAIKLGDRILILQEGAQVAQYDPPEAILASPANDFVADFVGAGSSLKQLSLSRVSEIELRDADQGDVGERTSEVKGRAEANSDRAVIVLDDRDRPTAWPWLRQLKGDTIHAGEEDLITVDRRATLNDALDTMLTSSHGAAVVTGDRDATSASWTSSRSPTSCGSSRRSSRPSRRARCTRSRTRSTSTSRRSPPTTGRRDHG